MPVKKEREYRTLVAPLAAQSSGEKRLTVGVLRRGLRYYI